MHAPTIIVAVLTFFAGSAAAACECEEVDNAGLYCGYCWEVKSYEGDGLYDAFWCNKKGGCEQYHPSSKCKDDTKYYCDGRDKW